jgi:hypothetical protein
MKVLEGAITNLGDGPVLAIAWRRQEIHEAIERGGILVPAGFKDPIRKEI